MPASSVSVFGGVAGVSCRLKPRPRERRSLPTGAYTLRVCEWETGDGVDADVLAPDDTVEATTSAAADGDYRRRATRNTPTVTTTLAGTENQTAK